MVKPLDIFLLFIYLFLIALLKIFLLPPDGIPSQVEQLSSLTLHDVAQALLFVPEELDAFPETSLIDSHFQWFP